MFDRSAIFFVTLVQFIISSLFICDNKLVFQQFPSEQIELSELEFQSGIEKDFQPGVLPATFAYTPQGFWLSVLPLSLDSLKAHSTESLWARPPPVS